MASKLQEYRRMSEEAQRQLTGSLERWQSFLTTASRLYKYPYHEQIMIHAQRPDATACADFDFWNRQWGRYVRRGSKGIALLNATEDNPSIRYVFDVADTGTRPNSREVRLWKYTPEHFDAVAERLERYGVTKESDLETQVEKLASQLAGEYWEENSRDICGIVAGSFPDEYDEYNIGVQFRNAASVSIAYTLMARCNLDPQSYFEHEDFLPVFDFNTPSAVAALGTAVSEISQQVLRQIEIAVKNYERERSTEHGRTDLHEERRLPDTQPEPERTGAEAAGQVREDEENLGISPLPGSPPAP
jgi:hypothetical protein